MPDITVLTSSDTWRKVQKSLSGLFGVGIRIVDLKGREIFASGVFPFLYEIIRNKKISAFEEGIESAIRNSLSSFKCMAGLSNFVSAISVDGEKIGAVIVGPVKASNKPAGMSALSSAIKVEDEELMDEYNKIKLSEDSDYEKIAMLTSSLFSIIATNDTKLNQKINELKFSDRLNKIFSNKNTDSAFQELVSFISSLYSLENCIIYLDHLSKKYSLRPDFFSEKFEKKISELSKNAKFVYPIPALKDEASLSGFEEIKNSKDSFLIIPINSDEKQIASIVLVSKGLNYSREDYGLFYLISSKILGYINNMLQISDVYKTAMTDSLTNLFNRMHFDAQLKLHLAACSDDHSPISLIIFDIDNFKLFNDKFGHAKGDAILREIGKIVKQSLKKNGIAFRYGGEEFAVILPKTNADNANAVAESLRRAVMSYNFGDNVTISVGLVTCLNSSVTPDTLLKEADAALYKAKNKGKNCVESTIIIDKNIMPVSINDANNMYVSK